MGDHLFCLLVFVHVLLVLGFIQLFGIVYPCLSHAGYISPLRALSRDLKARLFQPYEMTHNPWIIQSLVA
jgi:hypothetical protein